MVSQFDATYEDIVPGERIIYTYEMRLAGRKISVSLATFEFKRSGAGAKLIMTEQGAFLDGYDGNGSRERGSRHIIDKLSAYLEGLMAGHRTIRLQTIGGGVGGRSKAVLSGWRWDALRIAPRSIVQSAEPGVLAGDRGLLSASCCHRPTTAFGNLRCRTLGSTGSYVLLRTRRAQLKPMWITCEVIGCHRSRQARAD